MLNDRFDLPRAGSSAAGLDVAAETAFRDRLVDCILPTMAEREGKRVEIRYAYSNGNASIESDIAEMNVDLAGCATPENDLPTTFSGKLIIWDAREGELR